MLNVFEGEDGGGAAFNYLDSQHHRLSLFKMSLLIIGILIRKKSSNIMSIGIFDINPKSRGTIMVAHSDPEAYPSVDLNPLGNPDDLDFMVDQYIQVFNIMKRARKLDPDGIYKVVYPPENIFYLTNEVEKRNLLANYVKASYHNLAHFGGQCRMGRNVQEGVVDGFLNVFGTKTLK